MNEKIREMTSSQELRNIFRRWKWNQDSRSLRKIGSITGAEDVESRPWPAGDNPHKESEAHSHIGAKRRNCPDRPDQRLYRYVQQKNVKDSKCKCQLLLPQSREMAASYFGPKTLSKVWGKNLVKWHSVKKTRSNCVKKTRQLKVCQKKVTEKVVRQRSIFSKVENEDEDEESRPKIGRRGLYES